MESPFSPTTLKSSSLRQYDLVDHMSRADEDKIGAEQHPKILAEFGGAYNEGDVGAYVAEVVGRVASQSPMDPGKVRVTVLNSPIVNAMSPAGR